MSGVDKTPIPTEYRLHQAGAWRAGGAPGKPDDEPPRIPERQPPEKPYRPGHDVPKPVPVDDPKPPRPNERTVARPECARCSR
jgi:hypothetical protein